MSFFEDEVREGFYITNMMKRYWAAQLQVLARIDEVCKKHGLKWFADCGTLLGAVRHRGYIPWDDDLDICMLRHDYEVFFKVAVDELPKGYRVLTIHTENEYGELFGRVVNSGSIKFSPEHLKANFGCPYTVGIDIFPLDGLAKDEETEEKRRIRLKNVLDAMEMVKAGRMDEAECKSLLSDIERTEHAILHRRGNIIYELLLTADGLCRMYPSDGADALAAMPFWAKNHDHKYPAWLYSDRIYMPFEDISMPVPLGYNRALQIEYGDYMKTVKGGGAHDYPVYKTQEHILKENVGQNPYRYTMPATIAPKKNSKSLSDRCNEIIDVVMKAHTQIKLLCDQNDFENAGQLMEGCLKLVDSLERMLIGAGCLDSDDKIGKLDGGDQVNVSGSWSCINDYKSLLYEISGDWRGDESVAALDDAMSEVKSTIGTVVLKKRRQVLFIPCKAAWWPAMETYWRKEKAEPGNDVFVMPIPYMISDPLGENGETFDDSTLFPMEVELTLVDVFDVAARHPDVIYIQHPYDGWNVIFRVPEYFYAENLRNFTDELIYIPFLETDDPVSPDDKLTEALKVMIEQPAVYFADKVMLQSENLKRTYVDFLKTITGAASEEYWEDKIRVLDPGKKSLSREDSANQALLIGGKSDEMDDTDKKEVPDIWTDTGKKLMFYQITAAFIMEYKEKAFEKIRETIAVFHENADKIRCVFTPHENMEYVLKTYGAPKDKMCDDQSSGLSDTRSFNPANEYIKLLSEIKADPVFIVDEDHEAIDHIGRAAAYYGNPGYLAHMCAEKKIPVMIMSVI